MLASKFVCLLILCFGISKGSLLNTRWEGINTPVQYTYKMGQFLKTRGNKISHQCFGQLKEYVEGLKSAELWALRMIDSGAKIPSGLLEGNVVDLGFFDECLKVEGNITTQKSIFGKYCIGTIPLDVIVKLMPNHLDLLPNFQTWDITNTEARILTRSNEEMGIHLATCLPSGCSAADTQVIYAAIIGTDIMYFNEELCQSKASKSELDSGSIAMLSFLGVILSIMLISTAYDIAIFYIQCRPFHTLFVTFSVLANGKKLIATNNSANQINCLHGIRVITTMWVILAHKYTIQEMFPIRNSFIAYDWFLDKTNMFIIGATVSVDTFFLLSGLVLSYVRMSTIAKGTKFNIILFYLHRYLRLTPTLAVVAVIHITLLKHLGSGPLWPKTIQETLVAGCEKNWWKALLYIQNFGNVENKCVPQSWYLSVDMQLFLLSPILLYPLKFWPKGTLSAMGFLTICSIVSSFLTSWFFEFSLSMKTLTLDADKRVNYLKYYYGATWTRAGPWLIGLILGYFIFKVKEKRSKLVINKMILFASWVAALGILCICVFGGHDVYIAKYNKLETSFYISLVRPSWAIAVGWIIFACIAGYGGPVNWFLSLPIFQIISKFSYTLYMAHYTIIFMSMAQMRTTSIFDNSQAMYTFWGDFAFIFAIALVLTLAFESPMITIEKLLFGRRKERKVNQDLENGINTKYLRTA